GAGSWPGPGLAMGGRGGWGGPAALQVVEDLPHRGALADDLTEPAFVVNLLLQVVVLACEPFLQAIDLREELGGHDRGGGLRREGLEQLQRFPRETLAAEDAEHAHELVAHEERTAAD